MTKTDLIAHISAKTIFTKKDSAATLEATLSAIGEALAKGEAEPHRFRHL